MLLIVAAMLLSAWLFGCDTSPDTDDVPPQRFSAAELTHMYEKSVVELTAHDGVGTGIVLYNNREKGEVHIVTCLHVVASDLYESQTAIPDERIAAVSVRFYDGVESTAVTVIGFDRAFDSLILSVGANTGAAAVKPSGFEPPTAKGGEVLLLGNALGEGIGAFSGIVSQPVMLIKTESSSLLKPALRVTAAAVSGTSGGLVVDEYGRVLGMAFATRSDAEAMSYVLPFEPVYSLYKKAVVTPGNAIIGRNAFSLSASTADGTVDSLSKSAVPGFISLRISLSSSGFIRLQFRKSACVVAELSATDGYVAVGDEIAAIESADSGDLFAVLARLIDAPDAAADSEARISLTMLSGEVKHLLL